MKALSPSPVCTNYDENGSGRACNGDVRAASVAEGKETNQIFLSSDARSKCCQHPRELTGEPEASEETLTSCHVQMFLQDWHLGR